jgi:hypothetical protein
MRFCVREEFHNAGSKYKTKMANELWTRYYTCAIRDKHPEPERFADSAWKSRQTALRKKAERSKVVVLATVIKPEAPLPSAITKTKCQARTLEGRQCGFAATCGRFCRKHDPVKTSK